jgi:hypothetical protein
MRTPTVVRWILACFAALACAKAGLLPPGAALERLDSRGLLSECVAQLAQRGVAVTPPPEVASSPRTVGLGTYRPVQGRLVIPPPMETAARVREEFLRAISEVMTGGKWNWRRYGADDRSAKLLYAFHVLGLIYQGVIQHLQGKGVLKPGAIEGAEQHDAERIGTRARVAFLRHYVERVEPALRPLYETYAQGIRDLAGHLGPDLLEIVRKPPEAARAYWKERGAWLLDARSGQRVRGAFYIKWMVEDFASVDAGTHLRELPGLRLSK